MSYVERYESNTKDYSMVALGSLPGCDECGLEASADHEAIELADEPGFSWRPCDTCDSQLGGDRFHAHGLLTGPDFDAVHLNVCIDCASFIANGQLPLEEE